MELRNHQQTCLNNIITHFKNENKGLIKMFCGSGKSLIIYNCLLTYTNNLSVIVVPSINLITQFNKDYLHNENFKKYNNTLQKQYQTLSVCSRNEIKNDLNFTTDSEKILEFIEEDGIKIILITYQSLPLLIDIIEENDLIIDLVCFDEAHHILGDCVKKMLFEENYDEDEILDDEPNNNLIENGLVNNELEDNELFDDDFEEGNFLHRFVKKTLFFTATPKNSNCIKMHETILGYEVNDGYLTVENDEESICYDEPDCGKLIYEYKHTDGVRDNILNDFNVRVDLYTNTITNNNLTNNAILTNVLNDNDLTKNNEKNKIYEAIFRAVLETNNTKVLTFHSRSETKSNSASDVISFTDITDKELTTIYNKVFLEFSNKQKHIKIHLKNITASTKNKPKILELFENLPNNEICILASCKTIGEGVDTKNANMVVFVDSKSSYTEIIQNIGRVCRKNENTKQLATILLPVMVNVDKYKDCLTDIDRDNVIRNEMSNTGDFNGILNVISALRQEDPYMFEMCLRYPNVFSEKEIKDNIDKHGLIVDNNVVSKDTLFNSHELCYDNNISEFDNFKCLGKKIGFNVQIINNKVNENDIIVDNGFDKVRHFVKVNDNFKVVNSNDKNVIIGKVNRNIKPNVHISSEISVLWKFENDICVDKAVFGGYLKAVTTLENEEKWIEKLKLVEIYIKENNKRPSCSDKDKNIKSLGNWIYYQNKYYEKQCGIMKNIKIKEIWKLFIEKHLKYFDTNINIWKNKLAEVQKYINDNNKVPSNRSKDRNTNILGSWFSNQKINYNKQMGIMKEKEIHDIFTQFLKDNKEFFYNNKTSWKNNLNKIIIFINENNKLPTVENKNLEKWLRSQNEYYKNKTYIMKDNEIYDIFTNFLKNYNHLFINNIMLWQNTLEKIKIHINLYNNLPSVYNNNDNVKILGCWLSNQKKHYRRKMHIMKVPEIYDIFSQFLKEYEHLFINKNEIWQIKLEQVKTYITENNKLPSEYDKNNEIKQLGSWIYRQKHNYKNQIQIMKNPEFKLLWEEFVKQYLTEQNDSVIYIHQQDNTTLVTLKKPSKKTTIIKQLQLQFKNNQENENTQQRQLSHYQLISKKLSTQNSQTSQTMFQESPNLWHTYHDARDFSFQGYDNQQEIPLNKIITYLTHKTNKKLIILDLGCGRNLIKTHFEQFPNLNIIGYDHISFNNSIQCDISNLPNENDTIDICIFSQSLMGSNWQSYIEEAIRVLRHNGEIIISESVERYDIVKNFIISKRLVIKYDNYVEGNRWFYLHVLNDIVC